MRGLRVLAGVCVAAALAVPAAAQVDPQRARDYFEEARDVCERDAGRMWGVSLCGPMVIADARTRTLATSARAPESERPSALGFVNAPIDWGGTRWAAYIWDFITPLADGQARREFLLHELFHRVQPDLGLITPSGHNEHLDLVDGRYWLRLEWRALAAALRGTGAERARALRDALSFRRARRTAFPGAAESERVEEIREGLAQYTGTVLAAASEAMAVASALDRLAAAERQDSFVQSFAYTSGVAYGVLLDQLSPGWRRRVRSSCDLGEMVVAAAQLETSDDDAAAATRYGGAALRAAEETREADRKALVAELRRRFVDGPVLKIPSGGGGSFDIRGAAAIGDEGTVYFSSFRIKGEWGALDADKGVLVHRDGARSVPGPFTVDGATLKGDGWRVAIAPEWTVAAGPRPGDAQIVRR